MVFLLHHFLTLLIFLPTIGAIVMRFAPSRISPRWTALTTTLLVFVLSLLLLFTYDWREPADGSQSVYAVRNAANPNGVIQLVDNVGPLPLIHVQYFVGIDGLSLPLVLLITFICPLACIAGWQSHEPGARFFFLLLLLESAALGTYLALDLVLFFLLVLVSQLLIGRMIGGTRQGKPLVLPFVLAMSFSLILLLIAVMGVGHIAGSFDVITLPKLLREKLAVGSPLFGIGRTLFLLLMVAWLIRLPAFPLHACINGAQRETPARVNMLLVSIVQTSAAYGIFRVAYPLFPAATKSLALPIAITGLVSLLYGTLCAIAATDFKRLIAFISLSQMGFFLLGAAMATPASHLGATFMIFSHGLIISMLYVLADIAAERAPDRNLTRLGGLAASMPGYWGLTALALLAGLGLPLLCGFIGPFLILVGAFAAAGKDSVLFASGHVSVAKIYTIAIAGCVGTILSAVAMLSALHRVFFGPANVQSADPQDVNQRELTILIPLAVMIVLLGVVPAIAYFPFTRTTVDALDRMFGLR